MNGITFTNQTTNESFHSYNDLNLILKPRTLKSPSAKTNIIDIPGADGQMDFTEYFGEIFYNNFTQPYEFSCIESMSTWDSIFDDIKNKLHGRKMKITDERDPDFYRIGRVSVNEWKSNKSIGTITIDVNYEPYRYKNTQTIISQAISGSATINCPNLRKSVIPSFVGTAAMTITFGTNTFSVTTTETKFPDLVFKEGTNVIGVTGTGTLTIKYQEGAL